MVTKLVTNDLVLISEVTKPDARMAKNNTANLPDLDGFEYYLVSISGGKDSQAAGNEAIKRFGLERCRFVFCMVDDEEDGLWEFKENLEHIRYLETIWQAPIDIVHAQDGSNGPVHLTSIVLNREYMPGKKFPFCTRAKQIALWKWAEQFPNNTSCWIWGQRAEESPSRAKLPIYCYDTEAKRYVYRPVHTWLTAQVFADIESLGQKVNPVYLQIGNGRATQQGRANCKFCINAPKYELRKAVRRWPVAAQRFVEVIELKAGPRRDYSVGDAIRDAAIEDATPSVFSETDQEERELYELEKPVCGVGGGFGCEV